MSLQKFKLLATHCSTVAESPTRSPVIHLRRRKTLRLLINRSSDRWRLPYQHDPSEIQIDTDKSKKSDNDTTKRDKIRSRRKLRELFVSSPPLGEGERGCGSDSRMETERDSSVNGVITNGRNGEELTSRRLGFNGSIRPISLRCRLLRRAWRPVLVTIPEQ